MIFEHKEAFRIKFMGTSKSWIQVLKTRWAGPRQAQGRILMLNRNASMLSIIILEDLYWSEYFFLASLWIILKFSFSESKVSRPRAGSVIFENLNWAFGRAHKFDSKRFYMIVQISFLKICIDQNLDFLFPFG